MGVVVLQCSVGSLCVTLSISIFLKVGRLGLYSSCFTPASFTDRGRSLTPKLKAIIRYPPPRPDENSRVIPVNRWACTVVMSHYTSRVLAACSKGDIAFLHRISKETSLGRCLDKFGASPVHYAVRSGKRDCLQWLVMVGGLSPSTAALNGAMPVHDAAATGQLECLEWLVRKGGCDPEARDCAQATPLHLAARFGHVSVVEWLVREEHCSPMERAQNGATPVHLAAAKGSTNCLKWLTKKEPRYLLLRAIMLRSRASSTLCACRECM